ncbi:MULTISPECIES: hypothetical protein [Hyphobacterium]|uniref:Uncharacterized protein n=1 Tax=Hyphobacterium vulgare TaxID=1736751 RepID=A0ABV6ZUC0_9PROT
MAGSKSVAIELPRLAIETIEIPIEGDSPLIVHAFSKKAREAMLAKQTKKASAGRAAKNPWMDFCESLYWLDGMPDEPTEADVEKGRFGFPSVAFKSAMVTACTSIGGITKVAARQAFHVEGEYVELTGPAPAMREDVARVGMGTADLRYRGEFDPWSAVLTVKFNANVMSAAQVVNLCQTAGFAVGVGDWRPERDGVYGRFHVATEVKS